MNIGVAFRAFFGVLFNSTTASLVDQVLRAPTIDKLPPPTPSSTATSEKNSSPSQVSARTPKTGRNDAISLLSTLQREARLLDLVQESLDGYSDQQVGAAARDVLRDSRKVLHRLFGIEPLHSGSEGEKVSIAPDTSAYRTKLIGANTKAAQSGVLVHPGWIATTCQVPQWTGNEDDALVIAPAEVEVS